MEYLFSYGTLREPNVQIELFGRELTAFDDVMTGYRAVPISLWNETHHLAVEDESGRIPGVVLALSEAELAVCDSYEPNEYRRVRAEMLSAKQAWAYVAA